MPRKFIVSSVREAWLCCVTGDVGNDGCGVVGEEGEYKEDEQG